MHSLVSFTQVKMSLTVSPESLFVLLPKPQLNLAQIDPVGQHLLNRGPALDQQDVLKVGLEMCEWSGVTNLE